MELTNRQIALIAKEAQFLSRNAEIMCVLIKSDDPEDVERFERLRREITVMVEKIVRIAQEANGEKH